MQFIKNGPDIPERLLQAHEDGKVVFFCGAGISYPARLPGFGGLVERLYSELGVHPNTVQQAAIKARQYDTAIGLLEGRDGIVGSREKVRQQLAKILTPDLSVPNATTTHEALLTLARQREGRIRLITTNCDRIFEEVIAAKALSVATYQAPLLPVPKNRWDGLVYLHGLLLPASTVNDLDRLVMSSGDFGLAYLTERWAARFVSELFRNYTVCFVGYSINDPVLRYMMDALAADRLMGESPPEMFAFGSYPKGKEEVHANEWRAKNVTPILYREHNHHSYLHKTLQSWAATYRDGVLGKERIVVEYAMAKPLASTRQDDFVGRMLWALSDKQALPAKRFADYDPVPSLDWLEPLIANQFNHGDLKRFGVTPKVEEDEKLAFSLVQRPTPYPLAPLMSLVDGGYHASQWDDVMREIARWLTRHLNNPKLVLWVAKHGGRLHENFAWWIKHALKENSPSPMMQTLWRLVLSDRVKSYYARSDLYDWFARFKRDGLTPTLRLQLRDLLSPRARLREPFQGWEDTEEDTPKDPVRINDVVNWEIVLSTNHVNSALRDVRKSLQWQEALPGMLSDATSLLRDTLDLMRELGGADDRHDGSYVHQPSIGEHPQNRDFHDWTALINLVRDSWLATAERNHQHARLEAERWLSIPYPLFRRLAFFAAAHVDLFAAERGLDWLLSEDCWWLWSVETEREALRLLVSLAPKLKTQGLTTLERAILNGPPREMFRDDIEPERFQRIVDREIWLRLAKAKNSGATLHAEVEARLQALSQQYPHFKLATDERDEFPSWMSDGEELRTFVATPKRRRELVEWLRQPPNPDHWQEDDWRQRCRDNFPTTACALAALAHNREWPVVRWREALQAWAEESLLKRSWRYMNSLLNNAPDDVLKELTHPLGWWLQSLAKTFEGHEPAFFNLIRRILALERNDDIKAEDDPVFRAINHPIGLVTEATLRWWYRQSLEDEQGLSGAIRPLFTELCDTQITSFRHGRVVLATHVIALFRVDRHWTTQYLLPLFDWQYSHVEARAAWEGFLRSPRIYWPLMEAIKQPFLATAQQYTQLKHNDQYTALLTFAALEPDNTISKTELAASTRMLPSEGLHSAAQALVRALEGSGEQRSEYWRHRVLPYLKAIWPKSRNAITSNISESLARLCVAAQDAFPEALAELRHWLQPLEHPDHVVHLLHEAQLPEQFPETALEFLDMVIGDNAQWPPTRLNNCLDTIRRVQPNLEVDRRFQRLVEYLRRYRS